MKVSWFEERARDVDRQERGAWLGWLTAGVLGFITLSWMFWPAMQFVWHPDMGTWAGWGIWLVSFPLVMVACVLTFMSLQRLLARRSA